MTVNPRRIAQTNQQQALLTRKEWQFIQNYRKCSAADQELIFRALAGDKVAVRELEGRL